MRSPIVLAPAPVLLMRCTEVDPEDIDDDFRLAVNSMFGIMRAARGVGLAAPQIGLASRFAVIDVGNGPVVIVNPRIVESHGEVRVREGCLSLSSVHEWITRARAVRVVALNEHGHEIDIDATGMFAQALQHEIDHLDGRLFIDRLHRVERARVLRQHSIAKSRATHYAEIERRAQARVCHGERPEPVVAEAAE